jgi:chorismate mutase
MNDKDTSPQPSDWRNTAIDDAQADRNPRIAPDVARIEQLRRSIDTVDDSIVRLLAQRFSYTEEVGKLKAHAGFEPQDPERERLQSERLCRLAAESGLDPVIAQKYLQFVVTEAKKRHRELANRTDAS